MKTTGFNSLKSWGIVAACSLVMWVIQMPHRLSGLLFVSFIERYKTSRQSASLPTTVYSTLKCFGAPLAAYLAEIIGIRAVTILGCLIASLGVGSCFFAENITEVTISLGLIYGIGLFLGNSLMPQMLKLHFNKNLANAHGVTLAGACIGALVHPPVIKYLMKEYGISGTFLITAGMMLNGIPIAMLWHDPKYPRKDSRETFELCEDHLSEVSSKKEPSNMSPDSKLDEKHKSALETTEKLKSIGNYKGKMTCVTVNSAEKPHKAINILTLQLPAKVIVKEKGNICHAKADDSYADCLMDSSTNIHTSENKYKEALKTFLVFGDPPFLVIMLCFSLHLYIVIIMWIILIDVSRDKGIEDSLEVYYLMLLPVAEIFGNSCFGWVTDFGYLTKANYTGICFAFLGISCSMLVWANNFLTVMFAMLCFGIFTDATGVAAPGLVYQFLDESKHTMAIASRYVLYAPLSYSTAPLIGYFRNTLGSYDGVLYLLTILSLFSGGLMATLPCIAKSCKLKKNDNLKITHQDFRAGIKIIPH